MTNKNKLPVIGKRYKHKRYPGQECLIINITKHRVVYEEVVTTGNVKNGINSYKNSVVWDFLEELPDQEPTTEEWCTNEHIPFVENRNSGITVDNKVQEALEELKIPMQNFGDRENDETGFDFYHRVRHLVNALENVSNSTPLEKPSEDHILDVRKKVKSIWKPISELPVNKYQQLIIRWDNGENEIATYDTDEDYFMSLDLASQYCDSELREWCELSDFINQQISLEERITKLENK